jgi:hypothetical protein
VSTAQLPPDGMNLLEPDITTDEEIAQFREFYAYAKKEQNKSYEFWLEFRPDVLKRHKLRTATRTVGPQYPIPALAALHQYVISAFSDGIGYEIELARTMGARRGDVLDTISVAFIHSGHPGMYEATTHADALRGYVELTDTDIELFPPNWSFDPGAFDSGMDYSVKEASPEDLRRLTDWYERVPGEVPKNVRFLADNRPDLLKAYRNRYEHAIRESLPAQMLPFLMLHYNAVRGFKDGIRENALLGKALGMTRQQLLNAICLAELHGGAEVFDIVTEAAGDVLAQLPD